MKNLQNLLFKVPINSIYGNTNILIENLSYDSRKIKNKSIFFAIKGESHNGLDYINAAVHSGVVAIAVDELEALAVAAHVEDAVPRVYAETAEGADVGLDDHPAAAYHAHRDASAHEWGARGAQGSDPTG